MSEITFLKVKPNGKTEPLASELKSLHHQRAVLIIVPSDKIIFIAKGKNVKDKLSGVVRKKANELVKSKYSGYKTKSIPEKSQKLKIAEILNQKQKISKTKKKLKTLPKVNGVIPRAPSIPKSKTPAPTPLGDLDAKGPEIKKFQIAYIPDTSTSAFDSLDIGLTILTTVQSFFKGEIGGDTLKTRVNKLIDEVIQA